MAPPPNTPEAVLRELRILRRRGQHAKSVAEFLRRSAPPCRRRELVRERDARNAAAGRGK